MRALQKPPLLPSRRIRIRRFGQHDPNGPTVYVFLDVLDEIIFHARYRAEPSAMLLTGGLFEGPAGPYVELQGFMEAMYVGSTDDWLTTLQHRYPIVRDHLQHTSPDTAILGWVHGVPGGDARIGTDALVVHLTFFNLAHQLLLAVDPRTEQLALYRRGPDGRMRNIGFNVIARRDQVDRIAEELAHAPEAAPPTLAHAHQPPMAARTAAPDDAPLISGLLPRLDEPDRPVPSTASVDLDGDDVDNSWDATLAELPEDFLDVSGTPVLDTAPGAAGAPDLEDLLLPPEQDAREGFDDDVSLAVAAEIAAAVTVERERFLRPRPTARTSEDSLVSALKDIIQSTAALHSRPQPPSIAEQLDAFLPPLPRRSTAPGQLFGYDSQPDVKAVAPPDLRPTRPEPAPVPIPEPQPIPAASAILDAIANAEPEPEPEPALLATTELQPATTELQPATDAAEPWQFISFGSRQNLQAVKRPDPTTTTTPTPEPAPAAAAPDTAAQRPDPEPHAPPNDPDSHELEQLRRVLDVVRDALVEKAAEQSGTRWPAVTRNPAPHDASATPADDVVGLARSIQEPNPLNNSRDSGKHYAVDRARAFVKKADDKT